MRILPDGTVEIRNKKTGQTKVVSPVDLPSYNVPYSKYVTELEAAKKVGIETTAEIEPQKSADEQKRDRAKSDAERIVTQLEDLYFQGNLASGRLGGVAAKVGEIAGTNPELKTYESTKKSVRPTLARAAGDVGNLSLPEQKAAVAQLPGALSTPQEALMGFTEIRRKFGLPERDYGGALAGAGGLQSLQKLPIVGSAIQESVGRQQATMAQPRTLMDVLNPLKTGKSFITDVAAPAAPAALELAAYTSLLKGLGGKLFGGGLRNLGTKGALATRTVAAEKAKETGIKLSGKTMVKAGERYVAQDPLAKIYAEKVLPSIRGKQFNPPDLLERLKIWNKAYTSAGKTGKSSKAGFYDVLARAARTELQKKAPEVAKAQTQYGKAKGREELLRKLKGAAPYTAVSAATGGGMYWLLNKLTGKEE